MAETATSADVGVLEGLALGEAVAREVFGAVSSGPAPDKGFTYQVWEGAALPFRRQRPDMLCYPHGRLHPAAPDAIVLVLEHMRERWQGTVWGWDILTGRKGWGVRCNDDSSRVCPFHRSEDFGTAVFRAALAWVRQHGQVQHG